MKKKIIAIIGITILLGIGLLAYALTPSTVKVELRPASEVISKVYENKSKILKDFALTGILPTFKKVEE